MEHLQNPACSGCHTAMDDLGLGLENFDALGRYRETDEGLPIDARTRSTLRGGRSSPDPFQPSHRRNESASQRSWRGCLEGSIRW